jgi:hypothetical protein
MPILNKRESNCVIPKESDGKFVATVIPAFALKK